MARLGAEHELRDQHIRRPEPGVGPEPLSPIFVVGTAHHLYSFTPYCVVNETKSLEQPSCAQGILLQTANCKGTVPLRRKFYFNLH